MAGSSCNGGAPDLHWARVYVPGRGRKRLYPRLGPVPGARFDRLVVLIPGYGNDSSTLCVCDCDRLAWVGTRELRRGRGRCAPCSYAARGAAASARRGYLAVLGTPELVHLWGHRYTGIVSRCYDPNHRAWPNYGGRGIGLHEPWRADRVAFFRYAVTLHGWDDAGLDLDRIDNDRGYEPGNLRLVSRRTNAANRRTTVWLELDGERFTIREFRDRFCPEWRSLNTIRYHLDQGRDPEAVLDAYRKGRAGL